MVPPLAVAHEGDAGFIDMDEGVGIPVVGIFPAAGVDQESGLRDFNGDLFLFVFLIGSIPGFCQVLIQTGSR